MGDPDFRTATELGEEEASINQARSCTKLEFLILSVNT